MVINKKVINKALEYYNIDNMEYKLKCYECINYINNNSNLKLKMINMYNKLYDNKKNLRDYWKKKNIAELFGDNYHPFVTNIVLLLGYKIHIKNMKKYKFDKYQENIHKLRVKNALISDIEQRHYDGIRITQMLWGIYFINIKIIEVGRLQYELSNNNPINNKEEYCIKIHIPGDKKLDISDVEKSLVESKEQIKKYFKINDLEYYCDSWLLSKKIRNVIDNNSNIAKFSDLFYIIDGDDATCDILKYVYNIKECTDYNKLDEGTSLQKRIRKLLVNGIKIKSGIGKLKNNIY